MRVRHEQCAVVWLDDIQYFLSDMRLLQTFCVPGLKRDLPDYASALPWLLRVAAAKRVGLCGGFDAITTGEEDTEALPPYAAPAKVEARSSPCIGYMQPPAVAYLTKGVPLEHLVDLECLRFHCGGLIAVFLVESWPPSLSTFALNGSAGWSNSCQHRGVGCLCRRNPVSPWCEWGRLVWRTYNAKVARCWRVVDVAGIEAVIHHVTIVVFRKAEDGFEVLTLWRPTAGGHFTGWSVPGGNVERGKDKDVWAAAIREWNEEMIGYPFTSVVDGAGLDSAAQPIDIRGCHCLQRGDWLMFAANLGEQFVATSRHGGEVRSLGMSERSTATIFAPASREFLEATEGMALHLIAPDKSVTQDTVRQHGRKIHTDGWPFIEHANTEAKWMKWDAMDHNHRAGIFPASHSRPIVLPALSEVYGWV